MDYLQFSEMDKHNYFNTYIFYITYWAELDYICTGLAVRMCLSRLQYQLC